MAGDKAAQKQHAEVVKNEVASGKSANRPAMTRPCPNKRHGDSSCKVNRHPNQAAGPVGDAILEIDGEHRLPLAKRPIHWSEYYTIYGLFKVNFHTMHRINALPVLDQSAEPSHDLLKGP